MNLVHLTVFDSVFSKTETETYRRLFPIQLPGIRQLSIYHDFGEEFRLHGLPHLEAHSEWTGGSQLRWI